MARELTPRTRDLAHRLKQEIDNFTRQNPGTTPQDVRQAGDLATGRSGGNRVQARRGLAAALAGLGVAGVLAAVLFERTGGGGSSDQGMPVVAVAVGVALLVLLVTVVARRRG